MKILDFLNKMDSEGEILQIVDEHYWMNFQNPEVILDRLIVKAQELKIQIEPPNDKEYYQLFNELDLIYKNYERGLS